MRNYRSFFRPLMLLALMTMAHHLATAQADPCAPGCTGPCGPDYLHVNGVVRTNCLQVDNPGGTAPVVGYVLVAYDECGNVQWQAPPYGPTGPTGADGATGPTGATGLTGPTGPCCAISCPDPYIVIENNSAGNGTHCSDIYDDYNAHKVGVLTTAPNFLLDVNGDFQSNIPYSNPTGGAPGSFYLSNNADLLPSFGGYTGSGASYYDNVGNTFFNGLIDNGTGINGLIGAIGVTTPGNTMLTVFPTYAELNHNNGGVSADIVANDNNVVITSSSANANNFMTVNTNLAYGLNFVAQNIPGGDQTSFSLTEPGGFILDGKDNLYTSNSFKITNQNPTNLFNVLNNGTIVMPLMPAGSSTPSAAVNYVATCTDVNGTAIWAPAPTGPIGPTGPTGYAGLNGATGATGATGAPFGITGCTGITPYYDGTNWTADWNIYNTGVGTDPRVGIGFPACPSGLDAPLVVERGPSDDAGPAGVTLELNNANTSYPRGNFIRFLCSSCGYTKSFGAGEIGGDKGFVFINNGSGYNRNIMDVDDAGNKLSVRGAAGSGISLGSYDPGSGSSADPTPRQVIQANGGGNNWGGGSSRLYFLDESNYFAGASGSNTSLTHLYIAGPGFCDGVDRNIGIGLTYLSHPGPGSCPHCDLALTQPLEKLDIDGNLYVEGYNNLVGGALSAGCGSTSGTSGTLVGPTSSSLSTNPTGNVFASGGFYGSVMYTRSDSRFKKDIKPLEKALDKIKQLQGVSYNFRTDEFPKLGFGKNQQIGFIAQDVAKVVPEVVGEMPADREHAGTMYLGIEYGKLTALLVEGMKEQQTTIEQLTEKVSTLEKQLAVLTVHTTDVSSTTYGTETATPSAQLLQEMSERLSKLEQQLTIAPATTTAPKAGQNVQQVNISGGSFLSQNVPNPFSNSTVIEYHVAEGATSAYIRISGADGKTIKTIDAKQGPGRLELNFDDFPSQTLLYSLYVNDQFVDSKQMVKQ